MQTEDLIDWAMRQGWKDHNLDPYFADLGLSGTLPPDQRPDMFRLFDNIDSGRYDHGSGICFQENRLFRDETQIYYNQFIQKCLEHDVVVVVVSPYLMIYDFRDDLLAEIFRWKCKESADFIKRHVKGWMLPARRRAAWIGGKWAGYGDAPTGYIVDFNEQSPTYQKLIPYPPHAEKKRELRELFVEVGCNVSLLYQRLRITPIIFPEFENWVDQRNVNRFKMACHPRGGYYPKNKGTLVQMLTDPSDIGYRVIDGIIRRDSRGEKILDHDAICNRELFDLCYYPLAKTDLDGNPIDGKRMRRYFHQGSEGEFGLLKFRIRSTQGEVRTRSHGQYVGDKPPAKGMYFIESLAQEDTLNHYIVHAGIPCEEIDMIIVNRLMEHAHELTRNEEEIAEYEESAQKIRSERQKKLRQIENSIRDINNRQIELTRRLSKVEQEIEDAAPEVKEIKERRKQLIEIEIDTLEIERRRLIQAKRVEEEASESDLGTLEEELAKLVALWPDYIFERRRALINFIVKEVVIEVMSTHWLRVEVAWLHETWGREEMFYRRKIGSRKDWSKEEIAILNEHYATMPKKQLMALVPDRGWNSILFYAKQILGIDRSFGRGRPTGETFATYDIHTSYADILFMEQAAILPYCRSTNWEARY